MLKYANPRQALLGGASVFLLASCSAEGMKRLDKASRYRAAVYVIPSSFLGEWSENVEHCGSETNDMRMRVQARKIQFHESNAEVRRVVVHSARAVTVDASLAGEGETWNDSFMMVLSPSGNDLTIGGFTRHRC